MTPSPVEDPKEKDRSVVDRKATILCTVLENYHTKYMLPRGLFVKNPWGYKKHLQVRVEMA